MFKCSSIFLLILLTHNMAQAQGVAMADVMRENGKIYTVVAVLMLIFLGIVAFLVFLEIKLKKLEKDFNQFSDLKKLD